MSKFYVVATPIGNMKDITLRAIDTLREADIILCEDTRVTKKILERYGISRPTLSYHTQSRLGKIDKIVKLLEEGKNLALVSDAGTPTISDPGSLLISIIREDLKDVEVVPIPGATAFVAALSASGFPAHSFVFLGFLPNKKGRESIFKEIRDSRITTIFYESPHRIIKTLESLDKFCPQKKVCVAREMTKIYEEFKIGSPNEVLKYYIENHVKIKGEFTVIIA